MPNKIGLPAIATPEGVLFTLKDVTYTPETPRKKEPFTVRGKVELFGIPFLAPIWVIAKVTYPEEWWEEIIPIIGSPTVGEGQMALGGDFEITFSRGFDREGEFLLDVEAHAGPTYTIDKITLPPFPPMVSEKTTFLITGEIPPEELGFRNFAISGYGKLGEPLVAPPEVVELEIGDTLRVDLQFQHAPKRDISGKFHAAIWQDRPWDPHDEILDAEKVFTVHGAEDWAWATFSVDIIITSAISPGSEYGLYAKIMGITGGDIFTPYLANVITIVGVPPEEADIKDFDFKLTKGTYDIGDRVSFTAPYDYKGIEQGGQLTIEIGTGVYPTFSPVYTYESIPVEFPAAGDWETRGLEGNITLPPALEPGQTYSVRAKLETLEVPTQETDTDWSAFDITEVETRTLEIDITPRGAGYVTTSPAPIDIENHWIDGTRGKFEVGTRVRVTAHPHSGYVFDHWSDEIQGGTSTNNPELVSDNGYMYDNKAVKAHFREEEVPPEEYEGTISKKQLEYDGTRRTIPVSDVPQGKRGLVHIWGRNDMGSNQKMGIWWQVKDPDGRVVEEYARWEALWTGPGNAQEFIGGRFGLDKLGTYTIAVQLFMNPDDQVGVDDYYGDLCTITEVAPEYVDFRMNINGGAAGWVFPGANRWMCFYYDPEKGEFVGDSEWHFLFWRADFDNVSPGGYIAVYFHNTSTGEMSPQYTSPTWTIVDGHTYEYNPSTNEIIDIS